MLNFVRLLSVCSSGKNYSCDDYIRSHSGERMCVIHKNKKKYSDIPQKNNCYRKSVRHIIEIEMLNIALLNYLDTWGRNSKINLIK